MKEGIKVQNWGGHSRVLLQGQIRQYKTVSRGQKNQIYIFSRSLAAMLRHSNSKDRTIRSMKKLLELSRQEIECFKVGF